MPKFETERHVRFSPEQMFALVADVERYPEFLPLCEALTVRSRKDGEDETVLVAAMTVGFKAIRETFTTQVHLRPQERVIEARYLDGPFRYLTSRWRFDAASEGGTMVCFFVEYEFRNRMLGLLMGTMFDRAFRMFSEAFEKRAANVYAMAAA